MLCVDRRHTVEKSKADQRLLFDDVFDGANPRYSVFDPKEYRTDAAAVSQFRKFASEVREPVIKPDAPARGAGVGVWGKDFSTEKEIDLVLPRRLCEGEGRRGGKGRRRGVELPGLQ